MLETLTVEGHQRCFMIASFFQVRAGCNLTREGVPRGQRCID